MAPIPWGGLDTSKLFGATFTASKYLDSQSATLTKMLGGTSTAEAMRRSAAVLPGWTSSMSGTPGFATAASAAVDAMVGPTRLILGEMLAATYQPAIDAWGATRDLVSPAVSIYEAQSSAAMQPALDALKRTASVFDYGRFLPKINWADLVPAINVGAPPFTPLIAGATSVSKILDQMEARRRARERELSPDQLPPNLRAAASTPDGREHLHEVLLVEGLPLAYAFSEDAVGAVLRDPTPARRLERVWIRRAGILSVCENRLTRIRADHLQHPADLAWQALQAFRADLHGPAQAQAITLIDTHFTIDASLELEKLVTGVNTPHRKIRRLNNRAFAVHAPIAAIFSRDFRGQAHKHGREREVEPRSLSRQATIHGAGRRQYTKRNALLSIAMVTSLLCLLEDEHRRAAFSRS